MTQSRTHPAVGTVLYFALAFTLGSYFTFAAVQGDHGLFKRIQTEAEAADLRIERDRLATELDLLSNRTHRLSDAYLDLDLLDQRAREVLGMIRADELIVH